MANSIDKLAKEIKKEILASDERKPKPYDTQAEVVRVTNGTAWVHIPGGVEETPVRMTMDAKKGDVVNVHVEKGTAWITGNGTRPPTDDATANYATYVAEGAENLASAAVDAAIRAKESAEEANTSATEAKADAAIAKTAADGAVSDAAAANVAATEAKADASTAKTAATEAKADAQAANTAATEAKADASAANTAATEAKADAADAKTAATEAKADASTAKTAATEAKTDAADAKTAATEAKTDAADAKSAADDATRDATTAHTAATEAKADALTAKSMAQSAQNSADSASEYASRAYANLSTLQSLTETLDWITRHGTMTRTTDTELDPSHVYFVEDQNGDYIVGGQHYSVVREPKTEDLSTYYELNINESLNNYVATHLAVDSEGLWILPDAGGNKVLIATGSGNIYTSTGTYIIGKENGVDVVLSSFTKGGVRVGQESKAHLTVSDTAIKGVSDDGINFFSISSDGGMGKIAKEVVLDSNLGNVVQEYDLSSILGETWTSIANGEEFAILVEFYEKQGSTVKKYKATISEYFVKGTSKNDNANFRYIAPNTVTIKQYYPKPDSGYVFDHKVIRFGADIPAGYISPFYRFGQNLPELGGGNSFLMGRETTASYNNQLAIGEYNDDSQYALFMVGKGNFFKRRNIFEVGAKNSYEAGYVNINGFSLEDFVVDYGREATTAFGEGRWRWREWYSGKVEIWYGGSITLTTKSTTSGLYRNMRRIPFPNNYSLYRCVCIISGTVGGGWLNCGGLFNASNVHEEPYTQAEVMAYQINTYPSDNQTNVNIYICGEKTK